jgi:FHS family glucose/mannose:H+ symporter-like MFS transporter
MQAHVPKSATPPAALAAGGVLSSPAFQHGTGARQALAGFFMSGVLLSFLGAILPAWRHHLTSEYVTIALYFLGLIAGLVGSVFAAPSLLEKRGTGWTMAFACGIAGTAFLYLAFVSPPASAWLRVAGMVVIGCSAGWLHTAIFQAISPMYRHDPAATVNLAGIFFGLGCLAVALLVSGTFYIYTVPSIQVWIAVIPGLFGWWYLKTRFVQHPLPPHPSPRAILAEFRTPGAVLLSLLLFFQFGNEWAIAGWLPLYLSQRLGISPATALWILALYWLSLLVGRAASQWVLSRVSHARLLAGSVVASVFGCVILLETNNTFGAIVGILLVGGAFAPIYPLVVEKIGHGHPYYHPGFYNGIFSFAMAGGMLAPCTLGYLASVWGVQVVMGLPLVGSIIVFVLLMLIWLEARLSANLPRRRPARGAAESEWPQVSADKRR